jgi:hypothetical protein
VSAREKAAELGPGEGPESAKLKFLSKAAVESPEPVFVERQVLSISFLIFHLRNLIALAGLRRALFQPIRPCRVFR